MVNPADFTPIKHLGDLASNGQKPKPKVMPYTVPSLADFVRADCHKALAAKTRINESQQREETIKKFLNGDFDNHDLSLINRYLDAKSLELDTEQVQNFIDGLCEKLYLNKTFDESYILGIVNKTINEANVNYENQDHGTLLAVVAQIENHQLANKLADILLNLGADTSPQFSLCLPLTAAIEAKNTELIKKLLEHHALNINAQDSRGNTVLHNCIELNLFLYESLDEKADLIKLVLNLKPDLSICNNRGQTACEYWQGNSSDTRLCALLDPEAIFGGFNIFEEYWSDGLAAIRPKLTRDDIDQTIIGSPIQGDHHQSSYAPSFNTLLTLAIQKNDLEAARVFLEEFGANPNLFNAPLLTAVLYDNPEMVQLLLENKANPDLMIDNSSSSRLYLNTVISLNIENLSNNYQIQEAIKTASKIRPESENGAQELLNSLERLFNDDALEALEQRNLRNHFNKVAESYEILSAPYLRFAKIVRDTDYAQDYNPEADLSCVLEIGIRAIDDMIKKLKGLDMDPEYFALSLFEKAVLQNQSIRYNHSDIEETLNSAADYAKQANPVRQDILKVINELKEKL